jgi:hypothetical protein
LLYSKPEITAHLNCNHSGLIAHCDDGDNHLPNFLAVLLTEKEKIMKKLNVILFTGLVLLFTSAPVLAFNYATSNGGGKQPPPKEYHEPRQKPMPDSSIPVPEPTTILLLGGGLAALVAGTHRMKK